MPEEPVLDGRVVSRILRRATDLERTSDVRHGVGARAEASLVAAAEEVGLSVDAVRRSIAIERLGPPPAARPADRVLGPAQVHAESEVDVPAADALARVDSWLVGGHHLRRDVLRSGHARWSKRTGVIGATIRTIRNATGEGRLGEFEHVDATARDTGNGTSMVRVTVDRSSNRRLAGGGAAAATVGGMAGVVVGVAAAAPAVVLVSPAAIVAGVGVALSSRRAAREAEREVRRLLDSVDAGAAPTRLSVDVVRRATRAGIGAGAGDGAGRGEDSGRSSPARRALRSSSR